MIKNLKIQISEFFNKEKIKGTVVEFNTSETEGNREKATANDDSKSLLDDYIHPKSIWPEYPASGAIEYAPFNVEGLIMLFSGIKGITLLGKAVWKLCVKSFGKAAAKGSTTFFQGAKYSPKVMQQMSKADDIYHAFPKSVDGFATKFGQWSTKVGADGKTYQWLKMPGSYGGKTGTFEYIKDANGIINHRFFNVPKVP